MRNFRFKFVKRFIFVLLYSLIYWGCSLEQPLPENPYDPLNPNYSAPGTVITSSLPEIVTDKSVTFAWQQKDPMYNSDTLDTETYGKIWYRYRLNGGNWSPWSTNTFVTLDFLDDKAYLFEVMSKFPTNIVEDVPYPYKNFTMDAYQSSLVFSPRTTILSSNPSVQTLTAVVSVEEVTDMIGARVVVDYDPTELRLLTAEMLNEEGDFLVKTGGSAELFLEDAGTDTTTGIITMDIFVVMGDPIGISGSGDLVKLQFEYFLYADNTVLDTVYINFGEESFLRNSMNEEILEDRGDGVVYVW